jgi:hypothetical protein
LEYIELQKRARTKKRLDESEFSDHTEKEDDKKELKNESS